MKLVLRMLGIFAFVGLAGAWAKVLLAEMDGTTSTQNQNAFGDLTALLVLALVAILLSLLGRGVGRLVLGRDNRISTSKVQLALWTVAIGGALLSLVAATWVGPDTGFDKLTDPDFDFEPYLVLLGAPFAAAIIARVLVGQQVAEGTAAKPPGEPKLTQALTDDSGSADLVDSQYLLFNIVALVYFLGAFLEAPAAGLPEIPTILYVLTGAAAAGYVSNKAISAGTPRLTSIFPSKGPSGGSIELFAGAALFPLQPPPPNVASGSLAAFHEVRVTVGGRQATIVEGSLSHASSGDDRLKVVVPSPLPVGPHDVQVLTFRGVTSNPVPYEVL